MKKIITERLSGDEWKILDCTSCPRDHHFIIEMGDTHIADIRWSPDVREYSLVAPDNIGYQKETLRDFIGVIEEIEEMAHPFDLEAN